MFVTYGGDSSLEDEYVLSAKFFLKESKQSRKTDES